MNTREPAPCGPPGSGEAIRLRRRSFLGSLLALTRLPAAMGALWLRSSEAVVIRDGWVLSKDD
jgi:hypothetical protein